VLCTLKCLPLSRMITAFFSLSAMALPSCLPAGLCPAKLE
jgi:hypothetical protein